MKGFVFVLFISVLIAGTIVGDTISCKDEQGQNVDWFYAYKLPSKFPQNGHGQGVEFVYIKPGSTNWTLSPLPIDSLESVVGQTMAQAYSKESDPNRVVAAYNDEPPGHKSDSLNGHTKGVLVSDDRSGFWVVHSVPLYPTVTENPDDYSYPTTGHHYGQSFLCISVKVEEVDKIGLQLIYNEPHIYTFKISDNLRSLFPNLVEAANKKKITSPPYWNLATIRSTAGVNFESFAKGRHFAKELYEDWVAPTLDTDLYVETWRKGPGVLPSNCTRSTKVWNISSVKVVGEKSQRREKFYAYKLPALFPETGDTKGLEFLTLTPGSTEWNRSAYTIDSRNSSIGRTITQAYSKQLDPNRVVLAYNDSPPNRNVDFTRGHTKGILIADDRSGVWIVHSVPNFPNITENPSDYMYPSTGRLYGQNFLCISVSADQIDKIGQQLMINEANIYSYKIAPSLSQMYPNIVLAAAQIHPDWFPPQQLVTIRSRNGVLFQSFAKSRRFGKQLYEDWVAPALGDDLFVEVWRKGSGLLPSNCSQAQKVWNVAEVKIKEINLTFKSTSDHSKWAVSSNSIPNKWLCVGDINRSRTQQIRGGGTVCQRSATVGVAYLKIINDIESCD